jgi:hypothetical protein
MSLGNSKSSIRSKRVQIALNGSNEFEFLNDLEGRFKGSPSAPFEYLLLNFLINMEVEHVCSIRKPMAGRRR